jgi:hypothetical protein
MGNDIIDFVSAKIQQKKIKSINIYEATKSTDTNRNTYIDSILQFRVVFDTLSNPIAIYRIYPNSIFNKDKKITIIKFQNEYQKNVLVRTEAIIEEYFDSTMINKNERVQFPDDVMLAIDILYEKNNKIQELKIKSEHEYFRSLPENIQIEYKNGLPIKIISEWKTNYIIYNFDDQGKLNNKVYKKKLISIFGIDIIADEQLIARSYFNQKEDLDCFAQFQEGGHSQFNLFTFYELGDKGVSMVATPGSINKDFLDSLKNICNRSYYKIQNTLNNNSYFYVKYNNRSLPSEIHYKFLEEQFDSGNTYKYSYLVIDYEYYN